MMTQMVKPVIGERICDPAAGTDGFLVAAYEHILAQNTNPGILMTDEEGKYHEPVLLLSDWKKRYSEDQLTSALKWMRDNNIVPRSFGILIKQAKK